MENSVEFYLPKGKKVIAKLEADSEFENFEYINDSLKWVRDVLGKVLFSKGKNPVEYDIYVYKDKEINALAKKEKKGYIIALSSSIFVSLPLELQRYLYQKDIRAYFYGKKKTSLFHMRAVMKYCILFICFHEYYHILNGHCDYNLSSGYMMEIMNMQRESQYKESQVMEYDADFCAVRSVMYLILENNKMCDNRKMECIIFGFAIYYLFLKFQEQGYECFESCIIDLWATSHPYASIRMAYSIAIIEYFYTNHGIDSVEVLSAIKKLTEVSIYFDRVYYDADSLEKSLLALAYTEKGMQHVVDLDKGWNSLKKKLKNYSYIELRDADKLYLSNMKKNAWVTENGKFMNRNIL